MRLDGETRLHTRRRERAGRADKDFVAEASWRKQYDTRALTSLSLTYSPRPLGPTATRTGSQRAQLAKLRTPAYINQIPKRARMLP